MKSFKKRWFWNLVVLFCGLVIVDITWKIKDAEAARFAPPAAITPTVTPVSTRTPTSTKMNNDMLDMEDKVITDYPRVWLHDYWATSTMPESELLAASEKISFSFEDMVEAFAPIRNENIKTTRQRFEDWQFIEQSMQTFESANCAEALNAEIAHLSVRIYYHASSAGAKAFINDTIITHEQDDFWVDTHESKILAGGKLLDLAGISGCERRIRSTTLFFQRWNVWFDLTISSFSKDFAELTVELEQLALSLDAATHEKAQPRTTKTQLAVPDTLAFYNLSPKELAAIATSVPLPFEVQMVYPKDDPGIGFTDLIPTVVTLTGASLVKPFSVPGFNGHHSSELPAGEYTLHATRENYTTVTQTVVLTEAGQQIEISMQRLPAEPLPFPPDELVFLHDRIIYYATGETVLVGPSDTPLPSSIRAFRADDPTMGLVPGLGVVMGGMWCGSMAGV